MDTKVIMEKSSQCEPIQDLKIIGEIKNCHKGARKTIPSARNCHRDVTMLNSRVINRSSPSSEINVSLVSTSDTLNLGLFPITSLPDVTSTIQSKLQTGELEIKASNAENIDKPTRLQDSFKLTDDKISNSPASSQTKTHLLGNGNKIYNKRPLENKEFTSIDLDKVHKNPSRLDHPEYRSRNDENKQRLLEVVKIKDTAEHAKGSSQNEIFLVRKKFKTDADFTNLGTLAFKDIEITRVAGPVKLADTPGPFHTSKYVEEPFTKMPNNSKLSIQKSTQRINQQVNVDGSSLDSRYRKGTGRYRELQGSNSATMNRDFAPVMVVQNSVRMRKVENFVDAASSGNNASKSPYMPISRIRRMNDVRPIPRMMPPFQDYAYRNVLMPPTQAFVGRPQYQVVGTASRAMNAAKNQIPAYPLTQNHIINPNYAYTGEFQLKPGMTVQQNLNLAKLHNPANLRISRNSKKPKAIKTITRTAKRLNLPSHGSNQLNEIRIKQNDVTHSTSMSEIAVEDLNQPEEKMLTGTATGNNGTEVKDSKELTFKNIQDKNKIQDAQAKTMKVVELLRDIDKTFSEEFECAGLEESLPIWRAELVQCILSIEKISKVLSEYKEKNKLV